MARTLTLVAMLACLMASSAAAALPRWTAAHAQTALLGWKLAGGKHARYAHCNGLGLRAGTGVKATFARLRCTVSTSPSGSGPSSAGYVSANIEIRVASARRFAVTRCQTASAPLSAKVCP